MQLQKKNILILLLFWSILGGSQNIDSLRELTLNPTCDSIEIIHLRNLSKVFRSSNLDSSTHYIQLALKKVKKTKSWKLYVMCIGSQIEILKKQQKYKEAFELTKIILDSASVLKDTFNIVESYNGMGLISFEQNQKDKFYFYNKKALSLIRESKKFSKGAIYSNLGTYFMYQPNGYDSSVYYFNEAIKEYTKFGEFDRIPIVYTNMGTLSYYKDTKEGYQEALEYYLSSHESFKKIGNAWGIASTKLNIGWAQLALNQTKEAEESALQAIKQFRKQQDNLSESECMDLLVYVYKEQGEFEKAFNTLDSLRILDEKIRGIDQQKAILDLETKYETDKKEKENKILKSENELQNAEIERKNILTYSMAGGGLFLLAITSLIYVQFRNKKKANYLLSEKNEEIETQRDQLEEQNHELDEQKREITDSINYANRIQGALLNIDKEMLKSIPPHFILFKPKDIVSGDFYWALEKDGFIYITVADCTGHGVPGAFMSMLGVSFLNNIVKSGNNLKPAEILNELRERIINQLGQSETGDNKDGMDMSLIRYNPKNGELVFAGANNPLYIITKDQEKAGLADRVVEIENQDSFLVEIKADKEPIGYLQNQTPFNDHHLKIYKGESIYLFSDGYADQFGGPKDKKLGYKTFKVELLTNSILAPEEQKTFYEQYFENWMKQCNATQIDDVCVIGMKF